MARLLTKKIKDLAERLKKKWGQYSKGRNWAYTDKDNRVAYRAGKLVKQTKISYGKKRGQWRTTKKIKDRSITKILSPTHGKREITRSNPLLPVAGMLIGGPAGFAIGTALSRRTRITKQRRKFKQRKKGRIWRVR